MSCLTSISKEIQGKEQWMRLITRLMIQIMSRKLHMIFKLKKNVDQNEEEDNKSKIKEK